jgi:tetratricopeptide (TPR) repeat protein
MPRIAVCLLSIAFAALSQQDNLLDRLAHSPLTAAQQQAVASAVTEKDYSRAESVLTTAASAAPGQAGEVYALLGAVEFLFQRMENAARAFRQSDSLAPLTGRDRFTLAMALVRLGDTAGARAELTKLNSAQPDQPLYLYWLARLDYDQRRYEDSAAKLSRVVELDPQSPRPYDNLGLSLDMLGRYEEAVAAFRKAVELNRKLPQPSPWPAHNLGSLLLRLDKPEEAETALRESLRYDARFAAAHYRLGRVLEKLGRDELAIDEYRAAVSLDASLAEAYYSLGLLYRRLKRLREADAAFGEYKSRKSALPVSH